MAQIPFESKFYPVPINIPKTDDVVSCTKCGCTFMELILVQQFNKLHVVALGQQPAPKGPYGYWLFRCPKCSELYEPNVTMGPQDGNQKEYDKLLDVLEAPIMVPPPPPGGDKI